MKIKSSSLQIAIEYKAIDSKNWEYLELTPDEYFDLEVDEKAELDSIPIYNHAIDYLDIESNRVLVTKIILIDEANKAKRSIVERFWNQGKNRLIERTDSGNNSYWETILEIQISQEPPLWEILRIGRENEIIVPLYHGFLQDNEDGSQTETKVDLD